jgi:RES domain-containing protein
MVYLAEHPALAVLEVRVHLDLSFDLLPDDYVLLRVSLRGAAITDIHSPVPVDTAAAGDAWLASGSSPVLRVPSVLVPRASNLLLNPAHPDAAGAAIVETIPFAFDERLWAVGM